MRLGALLPTQSLTLDGAPSSVADHARTIESAGYDSVWVFDCLARGDVIPDPFVLLGALGQCTTHLEIGTGIVQLPLRNTVMLAHQLMSAHLLCGERLLFGVGCGSTRSDFDAVGESYENRQNRFQEQMVELRALINSGKHSNVDLSPWPMRSQPPPILLGTWGKAIETAASAYDGWIASAHYRANDELADCLHTYRRAGGRRAIVTNVALADAGGMDALIDRLLDLRQIGFDDACVFAPADSLREIRQRIPRME